jgi:hypothetical protein
MWLGAVGCGQARPGWLGQGPARRGVVRIIFSIDDSERPAKRTAHAKGLDTNQTL